MTLDCEQYEFSYESEGTSFIFEEIVAKYYLSWPGIVFGVKNVTGDYVPISEVPKIKANGLNLSKNDFEKAYLITKELVNKFRVDLETIKNTDQTKEDVIGYFLVIKKLLLNYSIFDMYYGDGIYENNPTDERVVLISGLKNKIRDDLDFVFFKKDGWLETILQTLAKQFSLSIDDIKYYRENELLDLFENKKVAAEIIAKRVESYIFIRDENSVIDFYEGKEAYKLGQGLLKKRINTKILQGKVANGKGEVFTAKVTVIKRNYKDREGLSKEMNAMVEGTILVSQTTDPELMPALRKARAIITDIGGMLSHSAISARELNIPCLVGVEQASKILKTGNTVEINTNSGIIRIIND